MNSICIVGNFPPRRCGIATFTQDLRQSLAAAASGTTFPIAEVDDGLTPTGHLSPDVGAAVGRVRQMRSAVPELVRARVGS